MGVLNAFSRYFHIRSIVLRCQLSTVKLRVGFIQVNRNWSTEYLIHKQFAEEAQQYIESFFFWQRNIHQPQWTEAAFDGDTQHNFYFDFGRDFFGSSHPRRRDYVSKALVMLPRLLAIVRKNNIELLYTSQQKWDIVLTRLISQILRIPYVVHLNYPVSKLLGDTVIRIVKSSPNILSCSQFVRQTALAHGVNKNRVTVIPNISNIVAFSTAQSSDVFYNEWGIKRDTIKIVCAGRIDPTKGQVELLESFDRLRILHDNVHLIFCGSSLFSEPDYVTCLENRVAELDLQKKVTFAGFRRDLPAIFASADIFALTTRDEAFGLVFVEAMAAGLPIVAYRSGATPEIIQDGITGLLVPEHKSTGILEALRQLIEDPTMRLNMGIKARQIALQKFNTFKLTIQWSSYLSKHDSF